MGLVTGFVLTEIAFFTREIGLFCQYMAFSSESLYVNQQLLGESRILNAATYEYPGYAPQPAYYQETQHSAAVGYVLWIFGFFGAHRFYFGRPISGILYAFTFGLFFIGWIVDLFFIPSMASEARQRHVPGEYDHNVAWLLHSFFLLGLRPASILSR